METRNADFEDVAKEIIKEASGSLQVKVITTTKSLWDFCKLEYMPRADDQQTETNDTDGGCR